MNTQEKTIFYPEKVNIAIKDVGLIVTTGENPGLEFVDCFSDDFYIEFENNRLKIKQKDNLHDNKIINKNIKKKNPRLILTLGNTNIEELYIKSVIGNIIVNSINCNELYLNAQTSNLQIVDCTCIEGKIDIASSNIYCKYFYPKKTVEITGTSANIKIVEAYYQGIGYKLQTYCGIIDTPDDLIMGNGNIYKDGSGMFEIFCNCGRVKIS